MADYFGHTQVPDRSELGTSWVNPEQIDMAGAEMFLPANQQIVDKVLGSIVTPGATILEIGAGLGHFGKLIPGALRERYLQTDQNPLYAKLSTANNGLPAAAADIYQLPFVNDQKHTGFNAVVAMDVLDTLHHLPAAAEQIAGSLQEGGTFVHFHNRRPSMTMLARPLGELGLVFPAADDDGGLRRFRIVRPQAYELARGAMNNPEASDVIASRPDLLDWLCEHEPETFLVVAEDIAEHVGNGSNETLTFVQLMHKAARSALVGAGMTVHYAGTARGEKLASRKWVAPLLTRSGMGKHVNVVTKQAGGILFDQAILPNGQALIRNDLSVLIAEKPTLVGE
jgi:SAM-dependent methyltransferase